MRINLGYCKKWQYLIIFVLFSIEFAVEHFAVEHLMLLRIFVEQFLLLSICVQHFVFSVQHEQEIAVEHEAKNPLLGAQPNIKPHATHLLRSL